MTVHTVQEKQNGVIESSLHTVGAIGPEPDSCPDGSKSRLASVCEAER